MTLIHGKGYSDKERMAFKEVIFLNTVQSMRVILEAMEIMAIQVDETNKYHAIAIMSDPPPIEADVLPSDLVIAIKHLWQDVGVQACFARGTEYQIDDSSQ